MNNKPNTTIKDVLVFLPVTLLFMYVYALIAEELGFLNEYKWQSLLVFVLGQIIILLSFTRNIRLLFIVAVTALFYTLISQLRFALSSSEFDTFRLTLQYRLLFSVLIVSYVSTFIVLRYRWGSLVYALFMMLLGMPYIIERDDMDSSGYLMLFSVLILLSIAVVIFSDIRFRKNINRIQLKRFSLYAVGALLLISLIIIVVGQDSKLQIAQIDDIQRGFSDSSLVQNKDGKVSVNRSMKPGGSNTNSNQLLLVANIENYFSDGLTPNPIYLTAYHYSKFDSAQQEFVTDSLAPDEDIFRPDVGKLPLTLSTTDSSIYVEASSYIERHTVKMTLYNVGLQLDEFLAPYTAYSVVRNPLTPDQASEYVSSYTTYSLVSDWNSAYFVYNPFNAPDELINFQNNRYEALSQHNDYKSVSPAFMRYYTLMPGGSQYDDIRNLATELVAKSNASTTIDKVLAIRDYYLSQNLIGEDLFEYTDNPGVPGVPDANLLHDFLFKTRKGYCAYFAGAGLFLLRAMNIPSRLSVGFMTVDRSDKNPGWYWYYQNQAHAWVQVYFPEVGWMDFDFTKGNDQAREASQADGTPPVVPENPEFTALGQIVSIDTTRATMSLKPILVTLRGDSMIPPPAVIQTDLSSTEIYEDSTQVTVGSLQQLDTVVMLTQDVDLIKSGQTANEEDLLLSSQSVHPDRLYRWMHDENEDADVAGDGNASTPRSVMSWLLSALLVLSVILILMPIGFFVYLFLVNLFSSDYKKHAFYNNVAVLYTLAQIGMNRSEESNLDFARRDVDPRFDIDYSQFMTDYLGLKYNPSFTPSYDKAMSYNQYFRRRFPILVRKMSMKERANLFFNVPRALNFILKYFFKS